MVCIRDRSIVDLVLVNVIIRLDLIKENTENSVAIDVGVKDSTILFANAI